MPTLRLAILMTCFNRRDATMRSLQALTEQVLPPNVDQRVFLVDDGSSDGTAEAVRSAFPEVKVIEGDGALFWAGGMRLAWTKALESDFDHYIWLNDDTTLYPDAFVTLLRTLDTLKEKKAIVVGSTQDPESLETTYGGVVRIDRLRAFRFDLVAPSTVPQYCETMNGNCVLIPRSVVREVGLISDEYTHGMGDYDYGLRAHSRGIPVVVAPGHVGTCRRDHPHAGSWRDVSLGRRERFRKIRGVKGLPPREWLVFSRRHGGPLWPVYWASPYLRILVGR